MASLTILTHPHPLLRQVAKPVKHFDVNLMIKINNMLDTMYAEEGVGLAANQVGYTEAMFVLDVSEAGDQPLIFINPQILSQTGSVLSEEGCLSVPDTNIKVKRSQALSIRAQNLKGERFELKNVEGLMAYCIQHEFDHLQGKLMIDDK